MKRLVLDASILVKLFVAEEHSETSERVVNQAIELLAPDLLWAEVASVMWKKVNRKQLSSADAVAIYGDMLRFPITTCGNGELAASALALAIQTGRSVYDCLYLALAIRENIPFLTGDERLVNALAGGPHAKLVRFIGALA